MAQSESSDQPDPTSDLAQYGFEPGTTMTFGQLAYPDGAVSS
jgi:hypothetical protein